MNSSFIRMYLRLALFAVCILALSLPLNGAPKPRIRSSETTTTDSTAESVSAPGQISKLDPGLDEIVKAGGRRTEELPVVVNFTEDVQQSDDVLQGVSTIRKVTTSVSSTFSGASVIRVIHYGSAESGSRGMR